MPCSAGRGLGTTVETNMSHRYQVAGVYVSLFMRVRCYWLHVHMSTIQSMMVVAT
jgi:hypothetical protein